MELCPARTKAILANFGGIPPVVDHHTQLCSTFFNIISSTYCRLVTILGNLRNNRTYNIPRVCTSRPKNSFILAMARRE